MLVGEVRWATSTLSATCELSGGSQCVAGPASSSKNRHVRRAKPRRNVISSSAVMACWFDPGTGRSSHVISAGATIQRTTKGEAAAKLVCGLRTINSTPDNPLAAKSSRRVLLMWWSPSWLTMSAVRHSSSLRRLIARRYQTRLMASIASHAWWGRSAVVTTTRASSSIAPRHAWMDPSTRSASRSSNGAKAGRTNARANNVLHTPGVGENIHAIKSSTSDAGATRLRRRLSKMRQRLITDSGLGAPWPSKAGTRARIH